MKRKPNIVRQLWLLFAVQVLSVIGLGALSVFGSFAVHHISGKIGQDDTHYVSIIRQHLENEQDPAQLRKLALTLLNTQTEQGNYLLSLGRDFVTITEMFCGVLLIYCFGTGLCAYRLQQQPEAQTPSA